MSTTNKKSMNRIQDWATFQLFDRLRTPSRFIIIIIITLKAMINHRI
jgi:hypothetical protein